MIPIPKRMLDWEAQDPSVCRITTADLKYIIAVREAYSAGVGFGAMQQIVEWIWQENNPDLSWGPEYYNKKIDKLEAEIRRLKEMI